MDDKKVDIIFNSMSIINLNLNIEEFLKNGIEIINIKNNLKLKFNEKDFYLLYYSLNGIEIYKIEKYFILTENGKNYSFKNSTFDLLHKRKNEITGEIFDGDFFTFNLNSMISDRAKIIEREELINKLKLRSKDIDNLLKNF